MEQYKVAYDLLKQLKQDEPELALELAREINTLNLEQGEPIRRLELYKNRMNNKQETQSSWGISRAPTASLTQLKDDNSDGRRSPYSLDVSRTKADMARDTEHIYLSGQLTLDQNFVPQYKLELASGVYYLMESKSEYIAIDGWSNMYRMVYVPDGNYHIYIYSGRIGDNEILIASRTGDNLEFPTGLKDSVKQAVITVLSEELPLVEIINLID